jgi:hypothetical protein
VFELSLGFGRQEMIVLLVKIGNGLSLMGTIALMGFYYMLLGIADISRYHKGL